MIEVKGTKPGRGRPFTLDIDELVPLQLRAGQETAGAGYLRLGNFSTTLLELGVEPYSQVLCEVTVTSIEELSPWPSFAVGGTSDGLPVLATDFEGWRVVDLQRDFRVAVREGEILLSWEKLDPCDACDFEGRVRFLVRKGRLVGIWFTGLSQEEVELFSSHARTGV